MIVSWQNRLARQSISKLLGKNSPTPIILRIPLKFSFKILTKMFTYYIQNPINPKASYPAQRPSHICLTSHRGQEVSKSDPKNDTTYIRHQNC